VGVAGENSQGSNTQVRDWLPTLALPAVAGTNEGDAVRKWLFI